MNSVCCVWVVSYVPYISCMLLKMKRLHFSKSSFLGSNGPQKFCIEKVGKETWLPRSHTWWVVTCKVSILLLVSLFQACIGQIKWNLIWINSLSPSSALFDCSDMTVLKTFLVALFLNFATMLNSLSVPDLSKVWEHPWVELRGVFLSLLENIKLLNKSC